MAARSGHAWAWKRRFPVCVSSVQVDFLSLTQGLLGSGECLGLSRNSSAVKLSLQRVTGPRHPLTPTQPGVSDAAEATVSVSL